MKAKFSELSSLVLVDTLAALPMEHVVRMARLGHERLRQTCSLKWVTDRMTDVSFSTVFKAYQARAPMTAVFLFELNPKETSRKSGLKLS